MNSPESKGINQNAAGNIVFSSRCGKSIGIVKIMATIGIFPFWEFSHKISFTYSYRKLPISQKVSTLELWDQLFWIPRIILHQKHPLPTRKNNFSIDLTQKGHFYDFCHNNHGKPMYSSTLHVLNACCISWVILFCFSYIQRKSKSCGKHSFWVQGGKTIGLVSMGLRKWDLNNFVTLFLLQHLLFGLF